MKRYSRDRIEQVFAIANADGIPCHWAANRLAEERIAALTGVRLLATPYADDRAHHR